MKKSKYPIIPLGDIAAKEKSAIKIGPFGSQLKKSELVDFGIHVLGIENVINDKFDGFGNRYISEEKFKLLRTVEVKPGDILITMMGTIGELAIVPKGTGRSIMDSHLLRFRPNTDLCDRKYITWAIKCSSAVKQALDINARGAIMQGLNSGIIKGLPIPLPPLAEQKRIAAILDRADAIRHKRQTAIKLADKFLSATFLDMFGDPVTNPKGWDIKPAGELLTFLTSGSRGWAKYYSDNGAIFLRIQNIGNNELILKDTAFVHPPVNAEARRTKVQPGDVLLSITADLGRTAVIPENFSVAHINQHLAILRFKEVSPIYASAFLASSGGREQIKKLNREGVKAGLNFDNIKSLEIMLPPESLQKKWVTIYNKVTHQNQLIKGATIQDNLFFNSLTQHAFRGEL